MTTAGRSGARTAARRHISRHHRGNVRRACRAHCTVTLVAAGYDGRVPALADLVLRTNAAPRGSAPGTTILPPAATLVICACRAQEDGAGRHRAPDDGPLRDVRFPTPSRRDSP
jgi:hypothetical protein